MTDARYDMPKTQTAEKANPDSVFSLAGAMCTRMNKLNLSQEKVDGIKRGAHPLFWEKFDDLLVNLDRIELEHTIKSVMGRDDEIHDWEAFYKKFFGLDVDLLRVRIPAGLDHTIFVAEGVSINSAVQACADRNIPFSKHCKGDLESAMRESERGPVKAPYAIRVRMGQEADDDLLSLSAEDIEAKNIDTESLLERLIHGLKYHDERGKYLDVKNVTLCTSSRYSNGDVPFVCRNAGGEVGVGWYRPQDRLPHLAARRVVR